MCKLNHYVYLVAAIVLLPFLQAFSAVKLPAIFTDNMVLQRNINIPVWGTAAPNENITVELSGKRVSTVANADGKWKAELPPFEAGGPYELKIFGKDTITFKNVMIGEVWICSGQSNMAFSVKEIGNNFNNPEEIAEAGKYNIRFYTVDPMTAATPQSDLKGIGWQVCDSSTVKDFSAVAYFFGKYVYQKINVPIGLINTSYGGTDIEAWTSGSSLKEIKDFDWILAAAKKFSANDSSFIKEYVEKRNEWKSSSMHTDPGYPATGISWKDTEANTSDWKTMNVPKLWDQPELVEFNGSVWYRKEVDIPASWAGKDLTLKMGPIDDIDVTWFNGTELGSGELWDKPRTYSIPAQLVKPGKNLIAIRCIDTGGPGGVWGEPNQYYILNNSGDSIAIAGEWFYKKTLSTGEFPPRPLSFEDPNCPTVLFNAMISPLIPYAIKGTIWYQGENNTFNALRYRTLFPLMINDWRNKWNEGNFPFFFVQLANFMSVKSQPAEDTWAELRESQLRTLKVENTGMALAIDIGDSSDIHPKNKIEVGRRLSLIALNKVYGFNNPYCGPIYKSYKVDGNKIIIDFDYAEDLKAKDGDKLEGFAIAGDDHKFYWANAEIVGSTVVVSSPNVEKPLAVRYAWASNPVCNLYNGANLPASPFRTDDWEVLTKDFE